MEGILFFVFWVGGATIHTIIELHLKKEGMVSRDRVGLDEKLRQSEGDNW
jgi:hypothetical protein